MEVLRPKAKNGGQSTAVGSQNALGENNYFFLAAFTRSFLRFK